MDAFLSSKSLQEERKLVEKRCAKYFSMIARGISHNYSDTTRGTNLYQFALEDSVGAEQVASSVIASKEASPGGTICLGQAHGKPLPIKKG